MSSTSNWPFQRQGSVWSHAGERRSLLLLSLHGKIPRAKPDWKITDKNLHLSPDGEWVSVFGKSVGEVQIIRIGARKPIAVVPRDKKADNAWTTVAPKGAAVAWKDKGFTVVRALPGGEPIARVKSGFGYDLRFSAGGQWLTEVGEQVFRVFDRSNSYKVIARIPAPSFILADVSGETAVVTSGKGKHRGGMGSGQQSSDCLSERWRFGVCSSPLGRRPSSADRKHER